VCTPLEARNSRAVHPENASANHVFTNIAEDLLPSVSEPILSDNPMGPVAVEQVQLRSDRRQNARIDPSSEQISEKSEVQWYPEEFAQLSGCHTEQRVEVRRLRCYLREFPFGELPDAKVSQP
jgi:hypothetical protein